MWYPCRVGVQLATITNEVWIIRVEQVCGVGAIGRGAQEFLDDRFALFHFVTCSILFWIAWKCTT